MKTKSLICFLALCSTAAPAFAADPLSFPTPLSEKLPFDVNLASLRELASSPLPAAPPYTIPDANVPAAQRLFDIFAWQTFIALNWPAQANGEPNAALTLADSKTPRVWESSFVDVGLVYLKDGAKPNWDQAISAGHNKTFWMSGMSLGTPKDAKKGAGGGYVLPVIGGGSGSLQAFSGPMIDQQGKWVRYQAAMNKVEFDYLVHNTLYNLEGQEAYTAKSKISFPTNQGTTHGAMEIKMSWKELSPYDDRTRFLVRRAHLVPLSGKERDADFGLVGMHVTARTESSPTWVWATFEHVDNTNADSLIKDNNGRPLRPTFFNTVNPTIPVNLLAPKNAAPIHLFNAASGKNDGPIVFTSWDEAATTNPTQTTMMLPVPKATAALNAQVQALLKGLGSVFQYYELIGTQWPSAPTFPGFTNGVATQANGQLLPSSHESIVFKVPGKVTPVFLVNTTMETFFQTGNRVAGPVADDYRLPPGNVADPSTVFSTESCAGCHFSAGACVGFKKDPYGRYVTQTVNGKKYRIPIFGQNAVRGLMGDADYSWLMQLRAQSAPYAGSGVDISTVLITNK